MGHVLTTSGQVDPRMRRYPMGRPAHGRVERSSPVSDVLPVPRQRAPEEDPCTTPLTPLRSSPPPPSSWGRGVGPRSGTRRAGTGTRG